MNKNNISKSIKVYLKRSSLKNHRSVFVILGAKTFNQIPIFCELLNRGKDVDFPVLCCYNSPEDIRSNIWFSNESYTNENFKKEENILPKITVFKYSDVPDILCQTFKLAVLYNIENISPNSLASVIQSVKGGGVLLFLFSSVKNIDEFSSAKVSHYIKSRFIKRLCLSLKSNFNFMILDNKLNILKDINNVSSFSKHIVNNKSNNFEELQKLKEGNISNPINCALINLCQTIDQAKLLLNFIDALKCRTSHSIFSVSSPKGRGKSAILGLAIACSIAMNYSNIFISSLNYENVINIFRFLLKGLDALGYTEDDDYDLIQSVNPKFKNALLGINIFKNHPQAIRFIFPGDVENKLEQAELIVIDQAASIPLSLLNQLLGSCIILMASTIEGYGGTGKCLYENMVQEVCHPVYLNNEKKTITSESLFLNSGRSFKKHILNEPIFYNSEDEVERWTNQILCLKYSLKGDLLQGCPEPQQCRLFYVLHDTLFSFDNHAELFLQQLMSLFLSSKKRISADILSKIADDPNYHIFCLLSPFDDTTAKVVPEILSAILVHTEKKVPLNIVYSGINQQEILLNCFNEWENITMKNIPEFISKCGIHILDIVTHPQYRKMGYGLRALNLLQEFYEGKWIPIDDSPFVFSSINKKYNSSQEKDTLPMLLQLTEVEPQKVEYLLTSFSLTPSLLKFWKKSGFVPIYISREKDSAQEHICLMMKSLDKEFKPHLQESWRCFKEYYFLLLSVELKCLPASFALNILKSTFSHELPEKDLTKENIDVYLNPRRMKSLEKYCQNLGDLHCIMPCIPVLTKLYFRNSFRGIILSVVQEIILLSYGLQHNAIEDISKDLGLPSTQVHGLLNRTIRKLTNHLNCIIERNVESTIKLQEVNMKPISQGLDEELEEAAEKIQQKQLEESKKLKDMDFSQYAIKGSEDDWGKALHTGRKTLVSIKSIKKVPEDIEMPTLTKKSSFKMKKKNTRR